MTFDFNLPLINTFSGISVINFLDLFLSKPKVDNNIKISFKFLNCKGF